MTSEPSSVPQKSSLHDPVINDFSITVGTRNGSGSATSNLTLLRALFRMGIPISGKNLFPSNIQGQPTWFTIRISKDGYLARTEKPEIVVAMNTDCFVQDVKSIIPGGVLFYDQDINLPIDRKDIVCYPMPVKQLVKGMDVPSNLRSYAANMVYVGVMAQILSIDLQKIYQAIDFHFKGKKTAVDLNYGVANASAIWASENLQKGDPYRVEPMDKTKDYILAEGNTAAALGSLYGGVQFVSWYPITPASTIPEELNYYLPMLRKDPVSGKYTCVVVQAEDELGAIGMAAGAGWAGLRAMTSTSGPGISLMAEFTGLAYYTETPIVIWNVARVGPSTGMPTRTAQGDVTFTYFLGHGDTDAIILFPKDPNECFEFGWKAFDYAERYQTPVFVMSDLDLGMQYWMTEPFKYPDSPMDRGKILWEEDLERLKDEWGRYKDVDNDGIPYRTLPGNRHPNAAWLARGTGHNEYAKYTESAEKWEEVMDRIKKKFETAREQIPLPKIDIMDNGSPIGLICYGTTWMAVEETRHILRDQHNIKTDYLRILATPFSKQICEFIQQHERVYIVELNRDGQMRQLLTMEYPKLATRLASLCHADGLSMSTEWLLKAFLKKEAE